LPEPIIPARILIDSARPELPEEPIAGNELEVLARGAVLVGATHDVPPQ
jgi:hypothetical protein